MSAKGSRIGASAMLRFMSLPEKPSSRSLTTMTELLLPQHANRHGTAFGGTVMAWMDICGAIVASRHAGKVTVTAGVDGLVFLSPIHVGDVVCLVGRINAAFGSSMEVEVTVEVEDMPTTNRRRCVEAFMTFVALDDAGKPAAVPQLRLESNEEKDRFEAAQARRRSRLLVRSV